MAQVDRDTARNLSVLRAQDDALNGYLESLLAGGQLDSAGAFAIDPARANLLSGSSLYTQPAAYLLKVIQAAVATRPEKVMIQSSRDAIEIHYTPTQDWPTPDEVEQAIKTPFGSHQSIHLKNLSLGLHAAAVQPAHWVLWGYRDSHEGWGTMLQGGECRRVELPPSRVFSCVFQLKYATVRQPFWKRVFGASRMAADTARLLADRCRFATCPIYLDHRLLNDPSVPRLSVGNRRNLLKKQTYFEHLVERAILSKQSLPDLLVAPRPLDRPARLYDVGGNPQNIPRYFLNHLVRREAYKGQTCALDNKPNNLWRGSGNSAFLHQWRSFSGDAGLFPQEKALTLTACHCLSKGKVGPYAVTLESWYDDSGPGSMLWVEDFQDWTRPNKVPEHYQERPFAAHAYLVAPGLVSDANSQLHVVQYGVTLESHPIQMAMPGMFAVVADNALETDLSGLKLVENQRFRDLVAWLWNESDEMQKDLERLKIPYEAANGPLQSF